MDTSQISRDDPERRGILSRLLAVFSEVQAGESRTVLLMSSNIFLVLVCYYILKTLREPLILLEGGAIGKSYAAAGQALILMAFIPAYSWFASRVDRMKLILGVTLFFLINIEMFALAVSAGVPYVGTMFFIWVGFFSLAIIAQFWSYANDIYSEGAGNRLFPIIGVGLTAGAPVGAFLASKLFESGIRLALMMHLSAAILLVTVGLYLLIDRREERNPRASAPAHKVLAPGNGFALVFKSRYISLIALLLILLNLVNTTGEYILAEMVTRQAAALQASNPALDVGAFIGAFYGNFFFWVNIMAVTIQAFLVSRLVKYAGLAGVLLALPVIALGAYGVIAAGVGFSIIRWAKSAENSSDYSIMNTARHLLWLPTTREEKYKAKQALDTFFVRAGDVLSALFVYLGTQVLHLQVTGFAIGNLLLITLWIALGLLILREHRRLTAKSGG